MIGAVLASMILFADVTPAATSAPAPPAPATTVAAMPTVKPADDPNAVVCHSEATVGTHLSHKVCMRRADAEQQRLNARDQLEKMQRAGGMGQTNPH